MATSIPGTKPVSVHAAAFGLFLATAAFTAFWLGLNASVPALQPTGIPSVVTRLIIHAAILTGLWLGLARTGLSPAARIRTWIAIALPFTAWLIAIWALAIDGALVQRPGGVPKIPLAIFVPVIVGLVLLMRSQRVAALLDATPPSWLIGLQAYRVFGGIFLVGWAQGTTPGVFALPTGIGDVTVGLLALPVAWYLHAGARAGRPLAYLWNVLGLVDLALAIAIGMLSAPGPLQLIVPDRPNALLGTFPTVMIPALAVPSSIILHALSLWQLTRLRRRERAGAPPHPVGTSQNRRIDR